MKERPILFSAPMVRAILEGRKTQTRRVVRLEGRTVDSRSDGTRYVARVTRSPQESSFTVPCPYGVAGDRLWVREAWSHDAPDLETCRAAHEDAIAGLGYGPYYRATECAPDTLRWRPAIHMPRWASRISLEVTNARVERLHEIDEADAVAEGMSKIDGMFDANGMKYATPRRAFESLWSDINGRESWLANPWVWVVEFRRVTP